MFSGCPLKTTVHCMSLIGHVYFQRHGELRRASIDIFGACYDEGRITRKSDPDPTWAALAAASIDRYAEIEREGDSPPHLLP